MGSSNNRIDTHHHLVPPIYKQALDANGGDPSGWPTPNWNLTADQAFSSSIGVSTIIFSITAPGPDIVKGEAAAQLARDLNEYLAALRDEAPSRYGFFAAVPSLLDTEAARSEIAYALDVLNADGVTLFTRYGEGNYYLGHEAFQPIWDDLDRRKAVVFIHPTHPVDTALVNSKLPQPVVDYPHETTRTAVDLVSSQTKRKHPNCKVILSHAGGTLPYLARRISGLADAGLTNLTTEQIFEDIASFYYDVALSMTKPVIELLLQFTTPDHLFFGSDYPYAIPKSIASLVKDFDASDFDENVKEAINRRNALKLFPRFET